MNLCHNTINYLIIFEAISCKRNTFPLLVYLPINSVLRKSTSQHHFTSLTDIFCNWLSIIETVQNHVTIFLHEIFIVRTSSGEMVKNRMSEVNLSYQ